VKQVKRLIVLLALALAFTLVLVPAGTAQAKKPLRYEGSGYATGYGWFGTITSGDLEGYTGIWVTRELDFRGENVYFYEEWFIGDGIEYVDGEVTGDVVLAGFDEGVTRFKNGKFTGNGRVTEAGEGWEHLVGRKEHLSGTVYDWGPPPLFTGTVQIN
jgi:hypothetical protein